MSGPAVQALAFPAPLAEVPFGDRLAPHGVALRPLDRGDLPWLRELYASTRAEEVAAAPWPESLRRAFLEQQFELQHRHFVSTYESAAFLAIVDARGPIGRLYLHRASPAHRIVDIALTPAWRGRGLGSAIIRAILDDASARQREVELHVAHNNPRARRLYERLGFIAEADTGMHARMRWSAANGVS